MSSFCDNKRQYSAFFGAQDVVDKKETTFNHVDWPAVPGGNTPYTTSTLEDLISNQEPQMRVIFAPLDLAGDRSLLRLFQHYDIPADFLTERLNSVAQANGTRISHDGSQASWFHYLCKNIDVREPHSSDPSTVPEIVESHQANPDPLSQENWTWLRSAFFLKNGGPENNPVNHGQSPRPCITLICFGASNYLQERFGDLATSPNWNQCLDAPYNLLVVVLDELFLEMDEQAWRLAGVFRGIEHRALMNVAKTLEVWTTSSRQDLVGLHNIAKHCVYLKEAFDAILLTIEDLFEQHLEIFPKTQERQSTSSMLKYKMGLFRSVNLRLASLDKRVANILSLSFNLNTAQDSRVMQKDSDTMKSIAALGLVFLPASTIAAIFSSPFFSMDRTVSPPNFLISENFWIFWSVVAPVTVIVILLWLAYHHITVKRWEKALKSH